VDDCPNEVVKAVRAGLQPTKPNRVLEIPRSVLSGDQGQKDFKRVCLEIGIYLDPQGPTYIPVSGRRSILKEYANCLQPPKMIMYK
jgi:hypothetical protein